MLPPEQHERGKENQKGGKQKKAKTTRTNEAGGATTKNLVVIVSRFALFQEITRTPLLSYPLPLSVKFPLLC